MTPGSLSDRRAIVRQSIEHGALLLFKGQTGARGCTVIDISDAGARLRTHNISVLSTSFELTIDNFSTIRCCRLMWRNGDLLGVAFES